MLHRMNRAAVKLGVSMICVFVLPLAFGGLFTIAQGIYLALTGPGNSHFWLVLLKGFLLSGVGFGLMFAALFGLKRVQREQRLEVEHPTEPWLWRADWAQGRVNGKIRIDAIAAWLFAIVWNLVSIPVVFLVLPQAAKHKGPGVYVALIFPIMGVIPIVRAIRQTVAHFNFDGTYFEMSSVPGVIGRELKGQIQARFPHSPDHGIHLRLSCVYRVPVTPGTSQGSGERILWRDEADVSSAQLYPGPAGTAIPVAFRIPLDAQPTEKRNGRYEFVWVLEALADVPGVDYHQVFEVPVFRTQQTPANSELEDTSAPVPAPAVRPAALTVRVRQNPEGTEYYFPAARNKNLAAFVTVILLIFVSSSLFLIHTFPMHGAGILIVMGFGSACLALGFGLASLLLLYFTIQLWFGTTRVVMGARGLTLQSGVLGGGKVQQVSFSEVASISDRIMTQRGGSTGTPYYDIQLTLGNGKKLTLGRSLRNKREAEWLVEEMRRLGGLQAKQSMAEQGGVSSSTHFEMELELRDRKKVTTTDSSRG